MVGRRRLVLSFEAQINDIVSYVRSFEQTPNPNAVGSADDEPLTISYDSPYSVDETVDALQRAAVGKNFRIIRVQTLENGLFDPDHENHKQVIVYFCNFQLLNDALTVDPVSVERSAGDVAADIETAQRALGSLKEDQREILVLGIVEGLTHSEIATRTGKPLGTVKTQMRRGLIRLRGLLEEPGEQASGGIA